MEDREAILDAILYEFVRTGYSWRHPRIKAFFAAAKQPLALMDTAFAGALLRKLQQEPNPSIPDRRKRIEESQ